MLKRQVRGLLNALSGAFSNRRFLQKLSMPKKAAAALVRPSDWEGALSELLPITQRLTSGPAAGLVTTPEHAAQYTAICRALT